MKNKKLAFVQRHNSPFEVNDYTLLSERYNVKKVCWSGFNVFSIIQVFFAIRHVDVVFCWFATDHAFFSVLFSKLLHKRSIVVIGGYDVAYVPVIKYGRFCNQSFFHQFMTRFVLFFADVLLPVSDFTLSETVFWNDSPHYIKRVYNGVDTGAI